MILRRLSLFAGAMMLAGTLALGGCSKEITKEKLWKDPTPGIGTLAHTDDQYKNAEVRVKDTNYRMIAYDWQYFWLYKKPSRMSEYPVP
jgi:hypothetical protein